MAKIIYPVEGPLAQSGTFSGKVAFSRGVKIEAGTLLFVSGALSMDKQRNLLHAGDMGAQTRQVLRNLESVLHEAGVTYRDVIKVTVFVKDITKFREIHDARLEFFHPEHLPASTMVQVSGFVHPDALIEIECVAVLPNRAPRKSARGAAARKPVRPSTGRAAARKTGRAAARKSSAAAARKSAGRVAAKPRALRRR
jgi:reactive intermediate/imine deaminase